MIKIIYIYALILFFNCASQGMPQGGPKDIVGPVLLDVYPQNKGYISKDDIITLSFDERISNHSIINSISIIPEVDLSVKVKGNKIIIKPLVSWPKEIPIEINIDRNISDFRSNKIDKNIQLIYNIGNKEYCSIAGKLFNTSKKNYNIYIYNWPLNNIEKPIKKINSDFENHFRIEHIKPGKYIIVASEGKLDIYNNRYGMAPYEYIELNSDNCIEDIYIYIDNPLEKLKITRVETVNQNLLNILYNNNEIEPYILNSTINDGDSIYINIAKNNRLHKYQLEPYLYLGKNTLDTVPPSIVSVENLGSLLIVDFSEPINKDSLVIMGLADTKTVEKEWENIDYENINSMSIKLFNSNLKKIKFFRNSVQDLNKNIMLDSIKVYSINNEIVDKGNSLLKGKVISAIIENIVVEAYNTSLNLSYTYVANDSLFIFKDLHPGKYVFRAYEQKNQINPSVYFSGMLNPYESAAKFSIYKDTVEVRKFWDTEGINIEF